jgi:hypothetical protein
VSVTSLLHRETGNPDDSLRRLIESQQRHDFLVVEGANPSDNGLRIAQVVLQGLQFLIGNLREKPISARSSAGSSRLNSTFSPLTNSASFEGIAVLVNHFASTHDSRVIWYAQTGFGSLRVRSGRVQDKP